MKIHILCAKDVDDRKFYLSHVGTKWYWDNSMDSSLYIVEKRMLKNWQVELIDVIAEANRNHIQSQLRAIHMQEYRVS